MARVAADYASVELVRMRRQAIVLLAALPVVVLPTAALLPKATVWLVGEWRR